MNGLVETAHTGFSQATDSSGRLSVAQSRGGGADISQLSLSQRLLKVTPYVVGTILLFAGFMKLYQILTGEVAVDYLPGGRWFTIALIEVELICGLALVCGFALRFFRRFAQFLFAAFLVYSVYQMAYGARSCGCLGGVEVAPAAMMGLDGSLLVATSLWRPSTAPSRPLTLIWSVAATCVGIASFALLAAAPARSLVEVTPDVFDLGLLRPGECRKISLTLRNLSTERIENLRIDTSCECLVPTQQKFDMLPLAQHVVQLTFDASKESTFRGKLLIEVTGWNKGGQITFAGRVATEISNLER